MAYVKDSGSFGQYMGNEYGGVDGVNMGVSMADAQSKIMQNKDAYPAGLQSLQGLKGYEGYPEGYSDYDPMGGFGLDTMGAAAIAQKNKNALPAGLQGYEGMGMLGGLDTMGASALAKRNKNSLPAGLQGYEMLGGGGMGGLGGLGMGGMDTMGAAAMAMKNKNALPAGLQGYERMAGLGGDDFDAFAGLDSFRSGARLNQEDVEEYIEEEEGTLDGLSGFGEQSLQSWHSHFNLAASAESETALINHLRRAVMTIPDTTPADIRTEYYNLTLKMLHRRKSTTLRHLDIKRVELRSGIGWLINPSLPGRGSFEAAMGKAVGSVGNALAKQEGPALKAKSLFDLGNKLKAGLAKVNALAGYGLAGYGDGHEGKGPDKKLLVGLGLVAAAGCWYYCKNNKKKKKAATARKRAAQRKARKNA